MSEDNMSQLMNTLKLMLNNTTNSSSSNNTEMPNSSFNSSSDINTSANSNSSNISSENSSFNISPEMINNMANMLKNSNNKADSDNGNKTDSVNSSLDFETIIKIKSIMDTLNNKDDPRSNLLYSLKPYLRKSRQDKLDQYANLFKITQVANIFNFKKGDGK